MKKIGLVDLHNGIVNTNGKIIKKPGYENVNNPYCECINKTDRKESQMFCQHAFDAKYQEEDLTRTKRGIVVCPECCECPTCGALVEKRDLVNDTCPNCKVQEN